MSRLRLRRPLPHRAPAPLLGCHVDQRLADDPLVAERVIERGLPLAVLPVVRWIDPGPASAH